MSQRCLSVQHIRNTQAGVLGEDLGQWCIRAKQVEKVVGAEVF